MTRWTRCCLAFFLVFFLVPTLPVEAQAATRGVYYRPAVTFVVENAPEDMIIRIDLDYAGQTVPVYLHREDRLWESYFRLYRQTEPSIAWRGVNADFKNATVVVITGEKNYKIRLSDKAVAHMSMNDIFMLDTSDYSIRYDLPLLRSVLTFSVRLIIVTVGALLVLFLFKYRYLKSWLTVLITTLVCQGAWNLFLTNRINHNIKLIYVLFVVILFILVAQLMVYLFTLNEQDRDTAARYTAWSNVVTGALNVALFHCFPL